MNGGVAREKVLKKLPFDEIFSLIVTMPLSW